MEWEIAPHSKYSKVKLVATEKIEGEIYLAFIGEDVETLYCSLNDTRN